LTGEPWRSTPEGVLVVCRLTPKAGRDAIEGVAQLADGTSVLAARVRAAPENGRANDALCALIAKALDRPASKVRLHSGARGRLKHVAVNGEPVELLARLARL
jgi:uncharacterized protein YggU (UPF0235/DUF167 family)